MKGTSEQAGAQAPDTKEIKISRTDPDSGFMVRDDKPRGDHYAALSNERSQG